MILLAVPVVIVMFFSLPWLLIGASIWLSPNPPKPNITYGEFPFELVYEIDGEVVTVKDTYICEYDGIGANEGTGKYRVWKGYIKGTGEETILLCEDEDREVHCFVGDAEYYMNDEKYPEKRPFAPRVFDTAKPNKFPKPELFSSEEIMDYYGIKIISYKFTDPIENSFG